MTTYTVTVVSTGSGNKYFINGVQQDTVYLDTNGSFVFDQSAGSNDGHPLQLSTTSGGTHSGGTRYDTGVVYTGDGSSVSASDYVSNFNTYTTRSVTITTTASTPNLFYYCANHPAMGGSAPVSDRNSWGRQAWGHGQWGDQAEIDVTLGSLTASTAVSSVSIEATIGSGWGRDAWSSLAWGVAFSTELGSLQSTFSAGTLSVVGDALVQPTGVSVTASAGTAAGEPEHRVFPTGVSSTTSLGSVAIEEGAGVVLSSLAMTFATGDETGSGTVDIGWGRNTWGSFTWNENIEFFANVTSVSITSNLGNLSVPVTGTGVIVNATGLSMTASAGTLVVSGASALVEPTGVTIGAALSGASGITGEGNVGVIAPSDQLDFAIGTPVIDIFTLADPAGVAMTSSLGSISTVSDALVQPTGVSSSFALGTATTNVGTGIVVNVSTVALSFSPGSVTPIAAAVVNLTGLETTATLGNTFETPWANVVTGASNTWTEVDAA